MKRRIGLSIALMLSAVVLALSSSDSTVKAEPNKVFAADTGIVTLGPDQTLRLVVANGLDNLAVRFRQFEYIQGTCDGGVCKHLVSSQTVSNPTTLAPGEGARYDIAGHEGEGIAARGVVTSNRQGLKVNVLIIKASTGEVVSFFDIFTEL